MEMGAGARTGRADISDRVAAHDGAAGRQSFCKSGHVRIDGFKAALVLYADEPAITVAIAHIRDQAGPRGADRRADWRAEVHARVQQHVAGDRVNAVAEA